MALFRNVEGIELYVEDLKEGLEYYTRLGFKVLNVAEDSIAIAMEDDSMEIVLQNKIKKQHICIHVESVTKAIEELNAAGGKVIGEIFDSALGKCAIVQDKWDNQYIIRDFSKF